MLHFEGAVDAFCMTYILVSDPEIKWMFGISFAYETRSTCVLWHYGKVEVITVHVFLKVKVTLKGQMLKSLHFVSSP